MVSFCQYLRRVCDNWSEISLLDVVGKVLGRTAQDRLKLLVEDALTDSQCGFRAIMGCTNMIAVASQLVEKTWEHHSDLFVLIVDLKKVCNSLPFPALWRALECLHIPSTMISITDPFIKVCLLK